MAVWHGLTTYYGSVYGLAGPIDSTGKTQSHWFTSCIAFSLIMHIIVFKLFIETTYWNWLTVLINIFCGLLFYYLSVVFGSMPGVGEIFQPEVVGQYAMIMGSKKAWICLIVIPAISLLPDVTYLLC